MRSGVARSLGSVGLSTEPELSPDQIGVMRSEHGQRTVPGSAFGCGIVACQKPAPGAGCVHLEIGKAMTDTAEISKSTIRRVSPPG
jgi:hypothetical protein